MRHLVDDYIFCSPCLATASLDHELSVGNPTVADMADPSPDPERALERCEAISALHKLVWSLTPRDREIVLSLFWRDETQATIARRLDVSGAAVSKVLSKVLGFARRQLTAHRRCCLLD